MKRDRLTNGEKEACKKAGLTIPGKLLFGTDKQAIRAEMSSEGAAYDGKDSVWVLPDQETLAKYQRKLGISTGASDKAVAKPEPKVEAKVEPEPKPEPGDDLISAVLGAAPASPPPKQRDKKLLVLPPSILVGGEISVPGDVRYQNLGSEQSTFDEGEVKRKEVVKTTKKTTRDPDGYAAAHTLAGELRSELRKIVQATPLGWICRLEREEELDSYVASAKQRAKEFNADSKYHFVRVSILKARIATDDETAARELAYEMQRMLSEMRLALDACDVKKIREVCVRAKYLKPVFPDREQSVIQEVVDSARAQARMIVKEVGSKGQQIDLIKGDIDTSVVDAARLMFLDFEAPDEMPAAEKLVQNARFDLDDKAPEPMDPADVPSSPADDARFSLDVQ